MPAEDHSLESHILDERINIRGALEHIKATLTEREKALDERFQAQENSAEFKRLALKDALDNAKLTTDKAMEEAKISVKTELDKAKIAADERGLVLQTRIEKLESGGAPFASRLDDGMQKLSLDVATLNSNAVRAEVIEALRERQQEDVQTQRRQIRNLSVTSGAAILIALVQFLLRFIVGA